MDSGKLNNMHQDLFRHHFEQLRKTMSRKDGGGGGFKNKSCFVFVAAPARGPLSHYDRRVHWTAHRFPGCLYQGFLAAPPRNAILREARDDILRSGTAVAYLSSALGSKESSRFSKTFGDNATTLPHSPARSTFRECRVRCGVGALTVTLALHRPQGTASSSTPEKARCLGAESFQHHAWRRGAARR